MLKKLTQTDDFNQIIQKGEWLVDFSASWCGPCRMLEPNLEQYAKEGNVLQVDIDEFSDLTSSFNIMSVPTLLAYRDGQIISKSIGYIDLPEINNLFKQK